jgi:hypothetical protein
MVCFPALLPVRRAKWWDNVKAVYFFCGWTLSEQLLTFGQLSKFSASRAQSLTQLEQRKMVGYLGCLDGWCETRSNRPLSHAGISLPPALSFKGILLSVQDAKLRASRSENAQLEGKVAQLVENEGKLQTKLVRKDFDLQHYHALKSILDDEVAGLEKALANLDEAARIRVGTVARFLVLCSLSSCGFFPWCFLFFFQRSWAGVPDPCVLAPRRFCLRRV